jgi:flagellar basal-body rod modification protein FlgD
MSSLTQAITPPSVASTATQAFSDAKVDDQTARSTVETKTKTDFRTLITNSMDDIKKERKAKENGDLSSGSDAEFLEKLADKSKEKRQPKNELGKDDFLKLFVTQLQNQDPMNPDDGTEMAAKLAQFNGLEQMMNVNKGIEKLITAGGTDRNMQMINYIGKEVTVDGGRVRLQNGQATKTEFKTDVPIASATLEVRDGAGILVNQVDLGPMEAGPHELKWDGKTHDGRQLNEGVFTYSVNARNPDGENIPIALSSKAKITGVDIKAQDGSLFSDFGRVTFDQIQSVGKPGYDAVETPEAAMAQGVPQVATPGMIGKQLNIPIPGAQAQAQAEAAAEPALPLPPTAAKNKTAASDSLDKLAAQGKLDLKKAGAEAASKANSRAAETKQNQEAAAKAAIARAGAESGDRVESEKAVTPQASSSAKLDQSQSPTTNTPAQAS